MINNRWVSKLRLNPDKAEVLLVGPDLPLGSRHVWGCCTPLQRSRFGAWEFSGTQLSYLIDRWQLGPGVQLTNFDPSWKRRPLSWFPMP